MMKAIFAVLLLVSISAAEESVELPSDFDALVRLIFSEPPKSNNNVRAKKEQSQIDWENSVCECVPYYQCNYNGSINENGEGIIDIRTGFVGTVDNPTSTRRPCDHYLSVCCLPPEVMGHDRDPTYPPPQGGQEGGQGGHVDPTYPPGQGGQDGQGEQGGNIDPLGQGGQGGQGGQRGIHNKPHVNKGCGYRNPNGVGFRITGNFNNEANFAEFPWMVAVLKEENIQGNLVKVYTCGGSLIHKRVVLTAAHCVHGKAATELTIRAGEWDTQTTDEPLPHQNRQVAVVVTHPAYQSKILFNDYALLILSQPVNITDNVEVVCLPEEYEHFDTSSCFATGWGKNEFGDKGHYQVILKAVNLPTVPHNTCQDSLRTTRLGKYFKLHNSFMCAGGVDGVDTCTGDGGSPLVCPLPQDPTRYTQAGIVAWGIGCGSNGVPGVYADITKGRRWIDETLASYNIDNISYTPGANNNYPPVPQQLQPGYVDGSYPQLPQQPNYPQQQQPGGHVQQQPKSSYPQQPAYQPKATRPRYGF